MIYLTGKSRLTDFQSSQVRSPQFIKWFGDWENDKEGKILDENGEPLVLYHGSMKVFSSFKRGRAGIYFTDSLEVAETYGLGCVQYAVYLKSKNPLVLDYHGESDISEDECHYALEKEARNALKEGYDAIIAYNTFDGESDLNQYVVFSPYQIKSATENNGDFSLDTDDIYR